MLKILKICLIAYDQPLHFCLWLYEKNSKLFVADCTRHSLHFSPRPVPRQSLNFWGLYETITFVMTVQDHHFCWWLYKSSHSTFVRNCTKQSLHLWLTVQGSWAALLATPVCTRPVAALLLLTIQGKSLHFCPQLYKNSHFTFVANCTRPVAALLSTTVNHSQYFFPQLYIHFASLFSTTAHNFCCTFVHNCTRLQDVFTLL